MTTTLVIATLLTAAPDHPPSQDAPTRVTVTSAAAPSATLVSTEPTLRSPRNPVTRMLVAGLAGSAGALVGGAAGFGIGAAVSCARYEGTELCELGGVFGLLPGALVGSSLGVYFAGSLGNGHGTYDGPLVGALVGAAAAAGMAFVSTGSAGEAFITASTYGLALVIAGAVVGYELSHHQNTPAATPVIVPAVGRDGAALSMIWRF